MPTKHLIIGAPQLRRQAALLARLEAAYDENTRTVAAQFLVPTQERASALRSAVVAHFGGRCWTPTVDTPDTLLGKHAHELGGPFRRLGVEARALLVQELAGDAPTLGRGPLTRSMARKVVGFLDAIAGDWYDGGPDVDELARSVAPTTGHAPDLARLARAYDGALRSRGFMDSRRLASSLISAWGEHGYPAQDSLLVIDEFALARPVDTRLMDVLTRAFDEVVITLPAPAADGPGLAAHRGFSAASAMARWAAADADIQRVDDDEPTRLQHVAASVFADASSSTAGAGDALRVLSYPDRREEIRGVARMIRRDLGDIAQADAALAPYTLVVSSYGAYSALVEETFREYGLAVNMGRGTPLSATPLLRTVHKLLSSVGDDDARWTIRELMDVLRQARIDEPRDVLEGAATLAGAPLDPATSLRPFSLARFGRLATRAGIGDAFDAADWYARMTTYQQHALGGVGADADMEPWDDELTAPQMEVARDLCIVDRFVQRLTGLAAASSPGEFGADLLSLLRDYGLTPRGEADGDDPDPDAAESDAWQAFKELLSQSVATFNAVTEPGRATRAGDLARYINVALSSPEARRPVPAARNAVGVLAPEQTVGLSFDRLYFVGLVEGEFPASGAANFLVEVGPVEAGGPGAAPDATPVDRFLFREALTNAQTVVLTYPTAHDGRTLSPSPFVDDVCALLGLSDDDVATDPTADAGVLCAREALEGAGRAGGQHEDAAAGALAPNVDALLRLAAARESVARWSEYDSYLATDNAAVAAILDAYTRAELSATQFDTYARCPARLFYSHLLRIGGQEDVEPDIAPNVRGIVIHGILEKFFSRGGPGVGSEDYVGPTGRARMLECARLEFETLDDQYPNLYWEEEKRALVLGLDDPAGPQGLLAGFLEAEDAQRGITFEGGYTRGRYNEVAFGDTARKDARVRLDAHVIPRASGDGDIRIKGYVDRVDADEETGRFVVFDYKTGANPRARDALDGQSFQLAIYMDALAGREGLTSPAGGAFYSVQDPAKVRRKDPIARRDLATGRSSAGMLGDEEFEEFRRVTRDRVREIEEHMRHGRFPVTAKTPQQAGCLRCDYRDVCRLRPARQRRMNTEQPHYDPPPFDPSGDKEREELQPRGERAAL